MAEPGSGRDSERQRVHALVFDDPVQTLGAVKRLRGEGFDVGNVHSPFPIHGMDKALGLPATRLPLATLIGALIGGSLKLIFQSWVHVIDWPMNIGGKPELALPALVPVTFELTVLIAAFATLGALLGRRRLYPRFSTEVASQPHLRVTDDRFVVLVLERDASFAPSRFRDLCVALGPQEVVEAWRRS